MKKQILLDIKKPCSENWESFTLSSTGGFCSSCSKTVIDFTKMNDEQILNFFAHQKEKTCGRLRSDQLKHYSYAEPAYIKPGLNLLKAGLLSLFISLASRPGVAQTPEGPKFKIVQPVTQLVQPATTQEKVAPIDVDYLIKGVVKSKDDDSPMAGVNILAKGTTDGTVSDIEGRFVFPRRLKEGEILVFSFIGFETQEYAVKKATENIELSMSMELSCVMLGDVAMEEVYQPKQSGIKRAWQKVKGLF